MFVRSKPRGRGRSRESKPAWMKRYVPTEEQIQTMVQVRSAVSQLIRLIGSVPILLIALRLIFWFMRVPAQVPLAGSIYDLSWPLVAPFRGFSLSHFLPDPSLPLDGPSLLALITYGIVTWIFAKFAWELLTPDLSAGGVRHQIHEDW